MRVVRGWLAAACVGLVLALSGPAASQQLELDRPHIASAVTLLQLNDVYSTVPVEGVGGLARVAALKRRLAAAGLTPFLVLAGDFLSSSVASTVFKGEQMIATLNAAGLDLATLGNHEFDFGRDVLLQRMAEAKWQWVVSNVMDVESGRPIGGAAPYVVRTFGALKVGFIGLCITSGGVTSDKLAGMRLIDPLEAAATYVPVLMREQVDAIVALTHLTFEEDRALAERFPEITVIIGGHEHFPIAALEGGTLISKAGSEARFVARIDLVPRATGVARFYELVPITAALDEHAETARVAASYEARLGTALDMAVGSTRVALNGVAATMRASETNLGNLVADALREAVGADVALVNSGGIRGDRMHPAGPLTRRLLLEMHPFGNVVTMVEVPGRVLVEALNHGVSMLPAPAGQFPQVSGMTFRVDSRAPPASRVRDVLVQGRRLDPAGTYTLAIPDFVLLGGDGYGMFKDQRVLIGPESGSLVVDALEKYVSAQGEVAPTSEKRIVISR